MAKKRLSDIVAVPLIAGMIGLGIPTKGYSADATLKWIRPDDSRVTRTEVQMQTKDITWWLQGLYNNGNVCNGDECSAPVIDLKEDKTYYFKARSRDSSDNKSKWSETISYTPSSDSEDTIEVNTAPSLECNYDIDKQNKIVNFYGNATDKEQTPSVYFNGNMIDSDGGDWNHSMKYDGGDQYVFIEAKDHHGGVSSKSYKFDESDFFSDSGGLPGLPGLPGM